MTATALMAVFLFAPTRADVAAEAAAKAAGSTVTETVTPPAVTIVETVAGPTVTAPAPGPVVAFGDGTYRVGAEVEPGTYQASNPNPAGTLQPCYWERRGPDGALLDNGVNDGLLFISPETYSIRVDGCGDWSRVG